MDSTHWFCNDVESAAYEIHRANENRKEWETPAYYYYHQDVHRPWLALSDTERGELIQQARTIRYLLAQTRGDTGAAIRAYAAPGPHSVEPSKQQLLEVGQLFASYYLGVARYHSGYYR